MIFDILFGYILVVQPHYLLVSCRFQCKNTYLQYNQTKICCQGEFSLILANRKYWSGLKKPLI